MRHYIYVGEMFLKTTSLIIFLLTFNITFTLFVGKQLMCGVVLCVTHHVRRVWQWLRWQSLRQYKLLATQATEPKLEDPVRLLYESADFIAIDKQYDIRINSNNPDHTVTVATQVAHQHPQLQDPGTEHGFRLVVIKTCNNILLLIYMYSEISWLKVAMQ